MGQQLSCWRVPAASVNNSGGAWYQTSSSSTVQPSYAPQKSFWHTAFNQLPTRHAYDDPGLHLPLFMSAMMCKSLPSPNEGPKLLLCHCEASSFPSIRACRNPFVSENRKLVGEFDEPPFSAHDTPA